jgi:hypothetical protein
MEQKANAFMLPASSGCEEDLVLSRCFPKPFHEAVLGCAPPAVCESHLTLFKDSAEAGSSLLKSDWQKTEAPAPGKRPKHLMFMLDRGPHLAIHDMSVPGRTNVSLSIARGGNAHCDHSIGLLRGSSPAFLRARMTGRIQRNTSTCGVSGNLSGGTG